MARRFMTVFIKNFTKNNPLSLPTSTVSCLNSVIFHTLLTGRRSFLDGTQCNIFCIIDAAVYACIKICWGDKKNGAETGGWLYWGGRWALEYFGGHTSSGLLVPAAVHGLQWADGAERRCLACGRGRWPFFSGQLRTAAAAADG